MIQKFLIELLGLELATALGFMLIFIFFALLAVLVAGAAVLFTQEK